DDPDIHRGMKADTAFVRPESRVELHPESAVDLYLAFVVHPGDAEDDLALRFAYAFDEGIFGVTGMFRDHAPEAFENLANSLVKFVFTAITPQHFGQNGFQLFINIHNFSPIAASE